jgi:hypothetical protein
MYSGARAEKHLHSCSANTSLEAQWLPCMRHGRGPSDVQFGLGGALSSCVLSCTAGIRSLSAGNLLLE